MVADRLRAYAAANDDVQVHLVGHSAGSIFLAALHGRLITAGVPVTSLTYLAPAIRTDVWVRTVLPKLRRRGSPTRFATFGLSDQRELDDVCAVGGVTLYRKSLLYLVSRGMERSTTDASGETQPEVPLLGMQRFAGTTVSGTTLDQAAASVGADVVWAPSTSPDRSRSGSTSHAGFDDDAATMTSVVMRVLGHTDRDDVVAYPS